MVFAGAKRIYEGLCDPYPQEPYSDRVEVIESKERGEGLRSLVSFKEGDVVFKFHGEIIKSQTLYTLQTLEPGLFVSDPLVMGKVLHSCDPNMECDISTFTFTAKRNINIGEWLSMDYETTEDDLFRKFYCACGAKNCRLTIRGKKHSTQ